MTDVRNGRHAGYGQRRADATARKRAAITPPFSRTLDQDLIVRREDLQMVFASHVHDGVIWREEYGEEEGVRAPQGLLSRDLS